MDLQQQIEAAISEGKDRIAKRDADRLLERRRMEAEIEAEINEKWKPILARVKEATPEWAHQFMFHPRVLPLYMYEGERYTHPITFAIPNLALIFAYAYPGKDVAVYFRAGKYKVVFDESGACNLSVVGNDPVSRSEMNSVDLVTVNDPINEIEDDSELTKDFYIAVAHARKQLELVPELLKSARLTV